MKMAFLCPSRRGQQKKKMKKEKEPYLGRITGSASVDTLVRVGLEKQHGLSPDSKMLVTQDFLATIEDELSAHTGDIVYMLYRDNDWIYAISDKGKEGFIPFICITPYFDKDDRSTPSHSPSVNPKTTKAKSKNQGSSASLAVPSHSKQEENSVVHRHKHLRRSATRTDDSMMAEEGSDNSSTASPVITASSPIPKPSRSFDVPDVISNNAQSSNYHDAQPQKPTDISGSGTRSTTFHRDGSRHERFKQSPALHQNAHKEKNSPTGHFHNRHRSSGNSSSSFFTDRDSVKENTVPQIKVTRPELERNRSYNKLSRPLGSQDLQSGPRHENQLSKIANGNMNIKHSKSSSQSSLNDPVTEVRTFPKTPMGKMLVIFAFEGKEENDIKVEEGELVTAVNKEDPLWTWVRKLNGQEGFVPTAYMCPFPEDLYGKNSDSNGKNEEKTGNGVAETPKPHYHDVRELVTLHRFIAQSADDISVMAGEQVFADLANQIEKDWLWVYAPSSGEYGYIPRDYVVHEDKTPLPEYKLNNRQRPP